jgi:hypothetical protein
MNDACALCVAQRPNISLNRTPRRRRCAPSARRRLAWFVRQHMSTEPVAFDAEYSPALIEQAALMFRDYRFRRYGRLLMAACIVNAVGFGLLLWLGAKSGPAFLFVLFIVVGGPVWLLYEHFVVPDRLAARLKRLLPQPMRVWVGKESICFVLRGREVVVRWSAVEDVLEAQTLFLFMRSPFSFLVLPKAGLPAEAYGILHARSRSRAA